MQYACSLEYTRTFLHLILMSNKFSVSLIRFILSVTVVLYCMFCQASGHSLCNYMRKIYAEYGPTPIWHCHDFLLKS